MAWTPLLVLFALARGFHVNLPVNLTATLNHSLVRPLASRFLSSVNNTLAFLANGSVGCTPKGGECSPGVPSCCPAFGSEAEDLRCLPLGGVHVCSLRDHDSEDLAQERITELEYGDSMGRLESHPWLNSWEFRSRSDGAKEEIKDLEEIQWKKQWKPSNKDNMWMRTYKKMKSEANNLWNDLRKMKKLKEIKESLLDKQIKRLDTTKPSPEMEKPQPPRDTIVYPDEFSEGTDIGDKTATKSEESVIKFSDEIPKQKKKIDFRLDEIVKDAVNLATKNLKKKINTKSKPTGRDEPPLISSASDEAPLHLDEIEETENNLRKELNELRKQKLQKQLNKEERSTDVEGKEDKLIKKHVHNVLEEERKLEKHKKLMELKKWEKQSV